MTSTKRFFVGGGGALMPVLISILAIDIGTMLDDDSTFNTANILGISIRYLVLFIIGGVVAYLHEDETNSFKLFELGVAAPALLTSLISAQGLVTETQEEISSVLFDNISIISSAYADPGSGKTEPVVGNNNFLGDVLHGISGKVYRNRHRQVVDPSRDKQSPEYETGAVATEVPEKPKARAYQ